MTTEPPNMEAIGYIIHGLIGCSWGHVLQRDQWGTHLTCQCAAQCGGIAVFGVL